MGRFMIPCCCLCGNSPDTFDDENWEYSDFCPNCATRIIEMYGEIGTYNLIDQIGKELV